MNLEEIQNNMNQRDAYLSPLASKNSDAIRLRPSHKKTEIRPPFFKDIDSIIYSLSYTRYVDKTQVFTNSNNDNISKRVLHVQLVNKIARTIGRALKLNEDLIEAIALGHDIGHTPFGHTGESILNKISLEHNEGYFMHNVQSVRTFLALENNGEGVNLSVQVLDGILCHNGEIVSGKYAPMPKTKEQFLEEYEACYHDKNASLKITPMTLEGCVVRISDVIAYIGRDIEDAIRLGALKKEDIPKEITDVLGDTNSSIVNTIVLDIIINSLNKNYIQMSDKIFKALNALKDFNYKHIYYKSNTKEELDNYEKMFRELFNFYLKALNEKIETDLTRTYLNGMSDKYKKENTYERIVIDYLAGMTDNYFFKKYKENIG